jgi:hypothetical protein
MIKEGLNFKGFIDGANKLTRFHEPSSFLIGFLPNLIEDLLSTTVSFFLEDFRKSKWNFHRV